MNIRKISLGATSFLAAVALVIGASIFGGAAFAQAAEKPKAPTFGGSLIATAPSLGGSATSGKKVSIKPLPSSSPMPPVVIAPPAVVITPPVLTPPVVITPPVVPVTPPAVITPPVVVPPVAVIPPAETAPPAVYQSPALKAAIARQLASTPGSVVYVKGGRCLTANYGTFGNGSVALNGAKSGMILMIDVWENPNGSFGFQWYKCRP